MRRILATQASLDTYFQIYCLLMPQIDKSADRLSYWYNLYQAEKKELEHLIYVSMFY
jgi:hypothetical protein